MPKRKIRIFEQLKESLETARLFEQGKNVPLRVTEIPRSPRHISPAKIKAIRDCGPNGAYRE